jgi:hypothetical protein
MSQTLTLPDELYVKLAQGAAERGLTIESLLARVSELVTSPTSPTQCDRERSLLIERLFAKYDEGGLTDQDRAELDRLIDVDYQEAKVRADRLIAAKRSQHEKSGKRPQKEIGDSDRPGSNDQKDDIAFRSASSAMVTPFPLVG